MAARQLACSLARATGLRLGAPAPAAGAFHLAPAFLRAFASVAPDLKYAESHEWVKVEGDTATVGISDFAQAQLGDVVYVELPEVGSEVTKGETFGVVESVKAASDVYSPVSGEVLEKNDSLADESSLVNSDAFGEGWMMKVKLSDPSEVDSLMDAKAYEGKCED